MIRYTRIVMALFGLLLLPVVTTAQDSLEFGVPALGLVDDANPTTTYVLNGNAGDVIWLRLTAVEDFSPLDDLMIVLQDADGEELLRVEEFIELTAFYELPADATYTLVAGRGKTNGDSSDMGEFWLVGDVLTEIGIDEDNVGTLDSIEDPASYYVYRGEDDFVIDYTRFGNYPLALTISVIDNSPGFGDGLTTVGSMAGADITRATFGAFPGGELYVISLTRPFDVFGFEALMSDYELVLQRTDQRPSR